MNDTNFVPEVSLSNTSMFERPCIAKKEAYLKANHPKLQDQTETILNENNNKESTVEVNKTQSSG